MLPEDRLSHPRLSHPHALEGSRGAGVPRASHTTPPSTPGRVCKSYVFQRRGA